MEASKKFRCFGNKVNQDLYARYHDTQWGVPVHNDRLLFEMLILEGAQAGLNWETILKRREGYRKAFYNFDPTKVAAMSDVQLNEHRNNVEIIRNRLKIYAARTNAKIFLTIQKEFGSFDNYIWRFVEGKPRINTWQQLQDIPAKTPLGDLISKDLKKRGMSFVGPTIIYAYMQAVGIVNDHVKDCWLRALG